MIIVALSAAFLTWLGRHIHAQATKEDEEAFVMQLVVRLLFRFYF